MEKDQVTTDAWNAKLYDQSHSFVSTYGANLIELLAPKQGERMLDLGCGTGDLTNKLFDQKVNVIGVDKSENMVSQARKKYPHLSFFIQDATALSFINEFDAVFSNATLHWVKQATKALESIYMSLIHGGRFVAEFGGKGNVETITSAIVSELKANGVDYLPEQFPWYYPSIGEYTSRMEDAGFRVIYAQHYDRPTLLTGDRGLRNWIEMFASQFFNTVSDEIKAQIIKSVENRIKDRLFKDGAWTADYKRIRVIGIKE